MNDFVCVILELPEGTGTLGLTPSGQWARQFGNQLMVWDEAMPTAVHFLPLLRVPLRQVQDAIRITASTEQARSKSLMMEIVQTALRSGSEFWIAAALQWVEEDALFRPQDDLKWAANYAPTQRLRHLARRYCRPEA